MEISYVPVSGLVIAPKELVDSPAVRRLQGIKQLALHPFALHTRFEHSLGCVHTAEKIMETAEENSGISLSGKSKVSVAALLHDVGHTPLSHGLEFIIKWYAGDDHEDRTKKKILSEKKEDDLGSILRKYSYEPLEIAEIASGEDKSWKGKLFDNGIDVDKLDYLKRDAHHTNVSLSADFEKIMKNTGFEDGKVIIFKEAEEDAVKLCEDRIKMYKEVYRGRERAGPDAVLNEAVRISFEERPNQFKNYTLDKYSSLVCEMEDAELMNEIVARTDYECYKFIAERIRNPIETPVEFRIGGNENEYKDGVLSFYISEAEMKKFSEVFSDFEKIPELQRNLSSTFDERLFLYVPNPKKGGFRLKENSGILVKKDNYVSDLYTLRPGLPEKHQKMWKDAYRPRIIAGPGKGKKISESFRRKDLSDILDSV